MPRAALISAAVGLQPRAKVVPLAVMTGGVVSSVQVIVRGTGVAALPEPSVTFQVRVCDLAHMPVIALSVELGVPTLQLSVAVAEPSAATMAAALGLQPSVRVVPVAVIVGVCVSLTVTVKLQLAVWPAASVAVQFTVVAPTENPDPDGGTQTTLETGLGTWQVTVYVPPQLWKVWFWPGFDLNRN